MNKKDIKKKVGKIIGELEEIRDLAAEKLYPEKDVKEGLEAIEEVFKEHKVKFNKDTVKAYAMGICMGTNLDDHEHLMSHAFFVSAFKFMEKPKKKGPGRPPKKK